MACLIAPFPAIAPGRYPILGSPPVQAESISPIITCRALCPVFTSIRRSLAAVSGGRRTPRRRPPASTVAWLALVEVRWRAARLRGSCQHRLFSLPVQGQQKRSEQMLTLSAFVSLPFEALTLPSGAPFPATINSLSLTSDSASSAISRIQPSA